MVPLRLARSARNQGSRLHFGVENIDQLVSRLIGLAWGEKPRRPRCARRFRRALHLALFMDARHDGVAIVPRHARTGCETPPPSNGSRRAVSPDTYLLALGRCEGFDVARLCHLVR